MKLKSILFALALSTASVFSQGLVKFNNTAFTPIYINDGAGNRVLMPTTPSAFTFYFTYGTSAGSLTSTSSSIFNSTTTAGRLAGNDSFSVPGAPGGSPIFLQLFGYSSAAGSYSAAAANGSGYYSFASSVIQITPSTSPAPGTPIFGTAANQIPSFDMMLAPVPEPSTIALGALGLGSLLFLRRRK